MEPTKERKAIRRFLIGAAIMSVVMLLFSCTPCPAQSRTTEAAIEKAAEGISTVYGDGKTVAKELLTRADTLASKASKIVSKVGPQIGNAADYTWQALIRQQLVKSIVWLIIWLKGIIFFLIAYNSLLKNYEEQKLQNNNKTPSEYDYSFGMILKIIVSIVSIIGVIIASFNIDIIVTGFANPEFGAIRDLIDYLQPTISGVAK